MQEGITSGEAQLFDVREPHEHAQGMLKYAAPVPLSALSALSDSLNKDKITYLHCAAGVRVHPAADILKEMGFEHVVPLQEGFASLYKLGFPLQEE